MAHDGVGRRIRSWIGGVFAVDPPPPAPHSPRHYVSFSLFHYYLFAMTCELLPAIAMPTTTSSTATTTSTTRRSKGSPTCSMPAPMLIVVASSGAETLFPPPFVHISHAFRCSIPPHTRHVIRLFRARPHWCGLMLVIRCYIGRFEDLGPTPRRRSRRVRQTSSFGWCFFVFPPGRLDNDLRPISPLSRSPLYHPTRAVSYIHCSLFMFTRRVGSSRKRVR